MRTFFANGIPHDVDYCARAAAPFRVDGDAFLEASDASQVDTQGWFLRTIGLMGWDAEPLEVSRAIRAMSEEWHVPVDERRLDMCLRDLILTRYSPMAPRRRSGAAAR